MEDNNNIRIGIVMIFYGYTFHSGIQSVSWV